MKKEYIERNALIAEYDRIHVGAPGGARKLMVDAPASDVVEVVRCKDCKHCKKHPTTDKIKMCVNNQWVMECYPLVHDNDFCSYGERKQNDQT
jgi:hypothetical protein